MSVSTEAPVALSVPPGFASALVVTSAIPGFPSGVPPVPPHYSAPSASSAPPSSSAYAASPDDHFDPGYPDTVLRDPEVPIPPAVPDSVSAVLRRIYAYVVYLFPQAAGSPSVDPPPRALFEDFFTPALTPQQPIYLNWFERVRVALADADSRLAAFLAAGRPDFSFLPSLSSQHAVWGDFAQGSAAPLNPSLLALFKRPLRPNLQLGLPIREAAALEASFHVNSESLSHSLWLLC